MNSRANRKADEICRLRAKRGLSYGQIARHLGVSRCAVAGVLRRAGLTDPNSPKAADTPRPREGTPAWKRADTLELAGLIGVKRAAKEMGVGLSTLYQWRRAA
jgi:transposase-like protein